MKCRILICYDRVHTVLEVLKLVPKLSSKLLFIRTEEVLELGTRGRCKVTITLTSLVHLNTESEFIG